MAAKVEKLSTMIVDSNELLESIRTQLIYSRLEDYKLYENGTAEYTIRFTSPTGVPMNRTMEIITQEYVSPPSKKVILAV